MHPIPISNKINENIVMVHCARASNNGNYIIKFDVTIENVTRSGQCKVHKLGQVTMCPIIDISANIQVFKNICLSHYINIH